MSQLVLLVSLYIMVGAVLCTHMSHTQAHKTLRVVFWCLIAALVGTRITVVQIGWILKGLVYAIIGGLACQSSAQGKSKIKGADISPQVTSLPARHLTGHCRTGFAWLHVQSANLALYKSSDIAVHPSVCSKNCELNVLDASHEVMLASIGLCVLGPQRGSCQMCYATGVDFWVVCMQLACTCDSGVQGAFILVGNNSFGYPLLVVMAVGVLIYACWRFWEGITGQGSDDAFGPFKNFFRYRLSPIISVCCC